MDVVKPFLVRGWEDKKKTKTRPAPLKRGLCLAHAEVLGWQTPNWPQSRSRTRWVSTYQMWESSGMGSLDFVKKFFAMAPRKRVTFGGEIVWSCLFMCKCSRSGGGGSYRESGPPGPAAGSWTDWCNTPAVPLWSSRGHRQNSQRRPAALVALMRKPGETNEDHNTDINNY